MEENDVKEKITANQEWTGQRYEVHKDRELSWMKMGKIAAPKRNIGVQWNGIYGKNTTEKNNKKNVAFP